MFCKLAGYSFGIEIVDTDLRGWTGDFTVADYREDLRNTFGFTAFEQEELDPDEVRDTSLKVARKLREFLETMAPKNPLPQASQQDL